MTKKLYIIGTGPGKLEGMTLEAVEALKGSSVIVGYTVYIDLVKEHFKNAKFMSTPMRKEEDRCILALNEANNGEIVSLICSGDAGVYGLSGLALTLGENYPEVEIKVIPGVTSALGGASLLGAPLIHDFCLISLSDLLTPWEKIEKRLEMAAIGDFSIVLYNPSSKKRHDYLQKACDILLRHLDGNTVCGIVRNIYRDNESISITDLKALRDTQVDMFTTVFIGNEATKVINNKMITPRGYSIERKNND